MDNNKEMIEGLVSQMLYDYHDDKKISRHFFHSQTRRLFVICSQSLLR